MGSVTPQDEIDLLRSLSASRWKIFRYVQLPEALPYIFTGLNIGLVLSVLGAIIGEFIGAKVGMGYLILQMNYNMDISGMFAALVVLGVVVFVLATLNGAGGRGWRCAGRTAPTGWKSTAATRYGKTPTGPGPTCRTPC